MLGTGGGYAVGSASVGASAPVTRPPTGSVYGGAPPTPPGRPGTGGSGSGGSGFGSGSGSKRVPILAAVAVLVVILGGGAIALALMNGGEDPGGIGAPTNEPTETGAPPTSDAPQIPPDEACTDAIKENPRWVCITSAVMTDTELRIEYDFEDNGAPFNINGGFHVHFYGANEDGSAPPENIMGSHVSSSQRGNWYIEDDEPSVVQAGSSQYNTIGDNPKVCARIANGRHGLVEDVSGNGTYTTGNCFPITRE